MGSDERVLHLAHPRVVGPMLELQAHADGDSRHGPRSFCDLAEIRLDADGRPFELAVPAGAEVAARDAGFVEMEDVLREREAGQPRGLGRPHHGERVAVGDEMVVVVVDARHRAARASASRKAPATSSRDQSWQS
jgi:hypothetical protein